MFKLAINFLNSLLDILQNLMNFEWVSRIWPTVQHASLVSYNSLYNRISQPRENLRWPMNFKWTTCAARKPSWDWCKLQLFPPFSSQSLHIASALLLVFAIWQGFTLTIVEIRKIILSIPGNSCWLGVSECLWNAWEFLGVSGSAWEFLPGSSLPGSDYNTLSWLEYLIWNLPFDSLMLQKTSWLKPLDWLTVSHSNTTRYGLPSFFGASRGIYASSVK